MLDVVVDTLIDSIKILPFLFLTYLIMEYIEHKTSEKSKEMIKKSGKFGPFFGSIVGIIPQCGFSVSATNLYAGRVITLGTLLAVYLSTSDEMLPILISEAAPIDLILKVLGIKLLIGMVAGFLIDLTRCFLLKRNHLKETGDIETICKQDHCHCEESILKSSITHTLHIFLFIIIITFLINTIIYWIGEDTLSHFIMNQPILAPIISGIIGLIPNCASSVILTKLFLSDMINLPTMMSGLLVNAGIGLLVLFRVNKHFKENMKIVLLLYSIGVLSALLLQWILSFV